MKIQLFATTHVGMVRDHNEDNFIVCENLKSKNWQFSPDAITEVSDQGVLLFVADGMGGTNAGEVASDIAQESIKTFFSDRLEECKSIKEFMFQAISYAHDKIIQRQNEDDETTGMGTTAILGWIRDNELHLAWSGDSRAYVVRSGLRPYPVTDDHSIVWQMVMEGVLTPEEARIHPDSNLIMQSLGEPRNLPKPSYKRISLQKGDLVILCSDGLNGMIPDEEIFLLGLSHQKVSDIVKELVNKANQEGGYDNITVLAARIYEAPLVAQEVADKEQTAVRKTSKSKLLVWVLTSFLLVAVAVLIFFPDIINPRGGSQNYSEYEKRKIDSIFKIVDSLESERKVYEALKILLDAKNQFPDDEKILETIKSLEIQGKTIKDEEPEIVSSGQEQSKPEKIDSLPSKTEGNLKSVKVDSVEPKTSEKNLNKDSEIEKIIALADSLEKSGKLIEAIILLEKAQKSFSGEKRILEKLKELEQKLKLKERADTIKVDSAIKENLIDTLKINHSTQGS